MEQSNALHKLTEAVDLIRMVEEITSPSSYDKLSASSLAGIRITLRTIRESVISSHDVLAESYVEAGRVPNINNSNGQAKTTTIIAPEAGKVDSVNLLDNATSSRANLTDRPSMPFTRRDLRASLEKLSDR